MLQMWSVREPTVGARKRITAERDRDDLVDRLRHRVGLACERVNVGQGLVHFEATDSARGFLGVDPAGELSAAVPVCLTWVRHWLSLWFMGIYQKANDLAIRLDGKNGAEARIHARAIAVALEEPLTVLVEQAMYQSQVLHSISERLAALESARQS